MPGIESETKEGCSPSARDVLWYVVFFGFAINYMVRININIAIVSMVRPRRAEPSNTMVHVSECFVDKTRPLSGDNGNTSAVILAARMYESGQGGDNRTSPSNSLTGPLDRVVKGWQDISLQQPHISS
uniref:Uncharacterized protein n=1 Tax=Timema genevievae TaxID=629358 RepID=A0A7R9PKJ2_TIMGE|nr:unnamed protein product [Timema genevievae]